MSTSLLGEVARAIQSTLVRFPDGVSPEMIFRALSRRGVSESNFVNLIEVMVDTGMVRHHLGLLYHVKRSLH